MVCEVFTPLRLGALTLAVRNSELPNAEGRSPALGSADVTPTALGGSELGGLGTRRESESLLLALADTGEPPAVTAIAPSAGRLLLDAGGARAAHAIVLEVCICTWQ